MWSRLVGTGGGSVNTPIAVPEGVGTVQTVTSFLRLVEDLLREPTERAAYLADPGGYLPARGFEDFDTADVEMSLQLTADALPPALAARLDPSAGLDTVVSIDIDELPGLWAEHGASELSLDEMADTDDPFLDEDTAESLEFDLESGDPLDQAVDGVDAPEGGPAFELDDSFPEPVTDGLTEPSVDPIDIDDGFVADEPHTGDVADEVADLNDVTTFEDDVPFD